jgi:hypothetical protein
MAKCQEYESDFKEISKELRKISSQLDFKSDVVNEELKHY